MLRRAVEQQQQKGSHCCFKSRGELPAAQVWGGNTERSPKPGSPAASPAHWQHSIQLNHTVLELLEEGLLPLVSIESCTISLLQRKCVLKSKEIIIIINSQGILEAWTPINIFFSSCCKQEEKMHRQDKCSPNYPNTLLTSAN